MNKLPSSEVIAAFTDFLAKGLLRDGRVLSKNEVYRLSEVAYGVRGTHLIAGKEVSLIVAIDESFPLSLPKIIILPCDVLGQISHVNGLGVVCWQDENSLLVDFENPLGILVEAFQGAILFLESQLANPLDVDEFAREFPAYWRDIKPSISANSFIHLDSRPRKVYFCENKKEKWFEDDANEEFFRHGTRPDDATNFRALYLPLEKVILPPPFNKPWTKQEFLGVLDEFGTLETREFVLSEAQASWQKRKSCYVLLSFPSPAGGKHSFGVRLLALDNQHPLGEQSSAELLSLSINRLDKDYLVPRGGATVVDKRVLLIGAGALGGHIALALAQSGLSEIVIVDPDVFKHENLFRHCLGLESINRFKVDALKIFIEKKLPYVRVVAKRGKIERIVKTDSNFLKGFDVIISATGSPSVERWLNSEVRKSGVQTPVLFSWLEPLGVGGHLLVTNNGTRSGCFECLFDEELYNLASFANRDNPPFAITFHGCSGRFVPFASNDALRTAETVVRTALKVIGKSESGNPLYSWKGDSSAFIAAGFNVSERFSNFSDDQLFEQRYRYNQFKCSVCG